MDNHHIDPETALRDYSKLAYGVARTYQNKGLPAEDLKQEALLGLVYAARNYQPEQGTQFSTYAVYWIKKQILLALERESSTSLRAQALEDSHLATLSSPEPPPAAENTLNLPQDMPVEERLVLQLSCENSLTLKEIAGRMKISVEKDKQLRGKALRRIKSQL